MFIFAVRFQLCEKVYIHLYTNRYTEKRLDILYSHVFYKFCFD